MSERKTVMRLEDRIALWLLQPGTFINDAEWKFIEQIRDAAQAGVGYGWMQQVIEWEWQSKGPGAWGPEYLVLSQLNPRCPKSRELVS